MILFVAAGGSKVFIHYDIRCLPIEIVLMLLRASWISNLLSELVSVDPRNCLDVVSSYHMSNGELL